VDNDVSAGNTTTIVGRLALGITLLAVGLGHTGVIDGVTAADAAPLAQYVGGIALFLTGLLAFRDRDAASGTAFTALGALWFTWAVSGDVSANAAGLFLLLFALVVLSLTLAGGGQLAQASSGPWCCGPSRPSPRARGSRRWAAGSAWPQGRSAGTRRPLRWLTGRRCFRGVLPAGE
jgi:hypothetical protein